MTTPSDTHTSSAGTARALSEERERHRAVFASQGDEASRKRFALPDPASPGYETSLQTLEADIDRASAALDSQDKAREQAQADQQLAEAKDDPAPLSDYKRAEAIKQGTSS